LEAWELGDEHAGATRHGQRMWAPNIGDEALRLEMPADASEYVRDEAVDILAQCLPPTAPPGARTGLVIGHVQSGKTLSFTTVTALAHDNGYPLVIVVGGTSNLLLNQSRDRLRVDLDVDRQSHRRWLHFDNPTGAQHISMARKLDEWPELEPADRPTILVTVMKHHQHLSNLAALLETLDLGSMPALLIDDEADQASLNTRGKRGEASTTYSQILRLRAALPHHTMLQYTATPQALLLISIADLLTPDFICLLSAGKDYAGGVQFFAPGADLVRTIGQDDELAIDNLTIEPPPGLLDAMRVFLVGVAAARITGADREMCRSMLIHPSRETLPHGQFRLWVTAAMDRWLRDLRLPSDDPDRDAVRDEFHDAYADVARTADLPPLAAVLEALVPSLRSTQVEVLNATPQGTEPKIPWSQYRAWILIGGQMLDRGYTVEGLTVTYMPREVGVGNADTLQQRARFYGYKVPYLGYCRVYLELGTREALANYVRHEVSLRHSLAKHVRRGESLRDWERAFVLDRSLKPTRLSVVGLRVVRDNLSGEWMWQRYAILSTDKLLDYNKTLLDAFKARHGWRIDEGDERRTDPQKHEVVALALKDLLDQLLIPYGVGEAHDSARRIGALVQFGEYLSDGEERGEEIAYVYWMSRGRADIRGTDADMRINNIFQGGNTNTGYPGDLKIRGANDAVTIQVHHVIDPRAAGRIVPVLAVWMPVRTAISWVAEAREHPDRP
jgi:hypothetical protein